MSLNLLEKSVKAKKSMRWVVLCAGLLCFQVANGKA